MNRPPRSSTTSSGHIIRSSEVRPILLLASSAPPGARAANTADTEYNRCSRIAAISSGLASGTPGTYQDSAGSTSISSPAAHSTIWLTRLLHEPQPLPARVAFITPGTVFVPERTQDTSAPLLTPLQLQTCASSASSDTPTSAAGDPRSNISPIRSAGSGRPRSNAWIRNATLPTSPSRVAPISRSSRITTLLYTPRRGSAKTTNSSSSRSGAVIPIDATSTPATFSLVVVLDPWYALSGS